MKLIDFSTLVQLGVDLHLGTALFQFIAEFASSPLKRKLTRLHDLANAKSLIEAGESALDALGDLEIKSVQFFNDYRNVIAGNAIVGILLVLLLIWITVDADESVPIFVAIFVIALSILPATLSLGYLSYRWTSHTKRLRERAAALEKSVIYSSEDDSP